MPSERVVVSRDRPPTSTIMEIVETYHHKTSRNEQMLDMAVISIRSTRES